MKILFLSFSLLVLPAFADISVDCCLKMTGHEDMVEKFTFNGDICTRTCSFGDVNMEVTMTDKGENGVMDFNITRKNDAGEMEVVAQPTLMVKWGKKAFCKCSKKQDGCEEVEFDISVVATK